MPQALTKVVIHLVFITKNRKPWLDQTIRPRVHGYLAAMFRDLRAPWVVVGGVADHVYVLFDMGHSVAPVTFVEHTKRKSSKFLKMLGNHDTKSYWQRGYAICSVSRKDRDQAEDYVRHQEEYHLGKSFQEAYRELLTRYRIEFDEPFVWD